MVFIYFNRPSGARQELERLDKAYKDSIGQITATFNKIITEKDHQMYLQFKKAQERVNRIESELVITQRQLKHEKSLNRRFTDSQTDSLLSRVGQ